MRICPHGALLTEKLLVFLFLNCHLHRERLRLGSGLGKGKSGANQLYRAPHGLGSFKFDARRRGRGFGSKCQPSLRGVGGQAKKSAYINSNLISKV